MPDIYNQSQMLSRPWETPFGAPTQRRRRIDLRGTVYHRMEEAGVFAANPANVGSQRDDGSNAYNGPVQFPKMLYHPKGELRVTNPGQKVKDVDGSVQVMGKQEELVHRLVQNSREEKKLLAEGWHEQPAASYAAGVAAGRYDMEIPEFSSINRVASLEAQLAEMQKELDAARAQMRQAEEEEPAAPTSEPAD